MCYMFYSPCSCDTSSVASDLSRIYVSEVEDKNDVLPSAIF